MFFEIFLICIISNAFFSFLELYIGTTQKFSELNSNNSGKPLFSNFLRLFKRFYCTIFHILAHIITALLSFGAISEKSKCEKQEIKIVIRAFFH